MVVADYGQIEMRVAAMVSGDRNMLSAYARGEDLHRKTAAAVSGVAAERVTGEQRQGAKAVNFGLLFGQGAKGLALYARSTYGVTMTEAQAAAARNAFFRTYPGLKAWQERASREAERTKRIVTPAGRILSMAARGGGEGNVSYTASLNTPIQGGAAEILLAALGCLERHLAGLDAQLVNVVHDEMMVEAAEADGPGAQRAVEAAMVEGMRTIFPQSPTKGLVDAHMGKNWADAK